MGGAGAANNDPFGRREREEEEEGAGAERGRAECVCGGGGLRGVCDPGSPAEGTGTRSG